MPNITVTIPDELYRHARIWAAYNNTSVSAMFRFFLEDTVGSSGLHADVPDHCSAPRNTPPPPFFP